MIRLNKTSTCHDFLSFLLVISCLLVCSHAISNPNPSCSPVNPIFSSGLALLDGAPFPLSEEIQPFPSSSTFLSSCENLSPSVGSCCNSSSISVAESFFAEYDSLRLTVMTGLAALDERRLYLALTDSNQWNANLTAAQLTALKQFVRIFKEVGLAAVTCLDGMAGYLQGMLCLACDPLGSARFMTTANDGNAADDMPASLPVLRVTNESCSLLREVCEPAIGSVLAYLQGFLSFLQSYVADEQMSSVEREIFATVLRETTSDDGTNFNTVCRKKNCQLFTTAAAAAAADSSSLLNVSLRSCEDCGDFFCHGSFGFRGFAYSLTDLPVIKCLTGSIFSLFCVAFRHSNEADCGSSQNLIQWIIPDFPASPLSSYTSSTSSNKASSMTSSHSSNSTTNSNSLALSSLSSTGGFALIQFLSSDHDDNDSPESGDPDAFSVYRIGCAFRLSQFACPNLPIQPSQTDSSTLLNTLRLIFLVIVILSILALSATLVFLFFRYWRSKGITARPTVTAASSQPAITSGITDNISANKSIDSTDSSANPISLSWPEFVSANAASPSLVKTIAAEESRGRKQDRRRAKETRTVAGLQQSLLQGSSSSLL